MMDEDAVNRFLDDVGRENALVLVPLFIEEASARVARLIAASIAGDIEAIVADAHSLKSSARTYGLSDLGNAAAALERECRAGQLDAARSAIVEIERLSGPSMESLMMFVNGVVTES